TDRNRRWFTVCFPVLFHGLVRGSVHEWSARGTRPARGARQCFNEAHAGARHSRGAAPQVRAAATTGGVLVILVTGATGKVGYRLMEALADAGADATAMVRVEAKGEDLPGSAKHIVATLDYPPPAGVLQSFDRVFLLSPANEEQAELEILFIGALLAAGHRPHVVKVAADGFQDPGCDARIMRSHR